MGTDQEPSIDTNEQRKNTNLTNFKGLKLSCPKINAIQNHENPFLRPSYCYTWGQFPKHKMTASEQQKLVSVLSLTPRFPDQGFQFHEIILVIITPKNWRLYCQNCRLKAKIRVSMPNI